MKNFEYREIRGWILKILYTNLPEPAGDKLISQILEAGQYKVTPLQVQGHLRYLAGKNYVELEQVAIEEMGLARLMAKLTSRGVDFVEGNLGEDPGVARR